VDRLFSEADHIVVEASVAAILLRRIHQLNPNARIIYYATDRLDTVGAHPFIQKRLVEDADLIEHVSLRSSLMADDFAWAGSERLRRIGFGIEPADFANIGPSPYPDRVKAAVSVGSMLFDPSFFHNVAPAFPEIQFHIIGCGQRFEAAPNVIIHNEMPFRATLPFLQHAAVGLAPYAPAPGVEYLSESSLKLAQYEYLGLPAACPDFAAGMVPTRFGYRPGDATSMREAFGAALNRTGSVAPRSFPTWAEIGQHLLHPKSYADTQLKSTLLDDFA
jgi:2-beta-glucuronyltransferase